MTLRHAPPPKRSPYRRPGSSDPWDGTPRHLRSTALTQGALTRRRWPRRILVGANILVALALVGAGTAFGYVRWRLDQIHRTTLPALTPRNTIAAGSATPAASGNSAPFTLLLVGSDSRAALSGPGNSQFGSAAETAGQRSDTIILVRVVPATRQLMILSIPRDLWGNIPGHGQNRINTAYDYGPNVLIQAIQQDIGIPINHYAEVNFDTFRDISSAVGGVKFYFPTPAKDAYSNLNVPTAGCYTLSGDQALAFVRSRHYQYYLDGYWHYEAESDLARIQRQQAFIKKMIKKASGEYTNLFALNSIIGGVTRNLTVDNGFSTSLMLEMAKNFRTMNVSGIPNVTLPVYPWTTSGGAEVLGIQEPQAGQTIADFNAFGTTKAKKKSTTSTTAARSGPTAATAPAVTVAPASVSIEVANGSGTNGQAEAMTGLLSGLGYHAVLAASPGYNHPTTVVDYAPDAATAARQVAAQIPGGATLQKDSALTPTAYSLEVITGSSYSATAPAATPGTGAGASSTASTTPTTVPGTNASEYQLPGSTGPPPANC